MSNYTHILVAVDFSSSADTVVERAKAIVARNEARLSILHVVEYVPPVDVAYEPILASAWELDETELQQQSTEALAQFCKKHGVEDANQEVVIGTPKFEISEYARQNQCDLIVMGAHGRHGIRLLLGSTANGVLHEMPCDVLAVKIAKQES